MPYKVLIVEDQEMPRQLFEIYVKSDPGFVHVASISNASLAVDFCERGGIDLILMDVMTELGSSGLDAAEEIKKKYYAVNCDLAVDVAKKAKAEGVKQFIFMSSAIIYGDSAPIGKEKMIGRDTDYSPANFYGDSKVQAEKGLLPLQDDAFKVVILRCPMIYGKEGKGNFPVLEKMALKMPVFPKVENKRSMLYVGNLAEFVRLMIENEEEGIFWPCNREWSNTSELVKMIAECHGKKVRLVPGFGWALKGLSHITGYVNKAFGNLAYESGLGDYKTEYRLYTLEASIKETEG